MARQRHVVVHHGAQRAVNEIKYFTLLHRCFVERPAFFEDAVSGVDESTPTRPEWHRAIVAMGRCSFVGNEFC